MKRKALIVVLGVLVVIVLIGFVMMVNGIEDNLKAQIKQEEKEEPEELPIFMANSTDLDTLYFNAQSNASLAAVMDNYAQDIGLQDASEYTMVLNRLMDFFDLLEQGKYETAYSFVSPAYLDFKGILDVEEFASYVKEKGMDIVTCTVISGTKYDKYQVLNVSLMKPLQPEFADEFLIREKSQIANETIIYFQENDGYKLSFDGYIDSLFFESDEIGASIEKIQRFHDHFIATVKFRKSEEPIEDRSLNITIRGEGDKIISSKTIRIPLEDALLKVESDILIDSVFNVRYNDKMKIEVGHE